ncbi:MAG: LPXTG cell wall anchor domain-containing protein [Saccharothrix sp.]|nr:LPXTG cell wall anchor domain-containing protein [Saccharothrix sp.]
MSRRLLLAATAALGLFFAPVAATADPGNGNGTDPGFSPPGQSQEHGQAGDQGQAGEHGQGQPAQGGPAQEDTNAPQPPSNADFTDHGANTHGPYDSTRDGSLSENGNGDGQQVGQPCAGCVGNADNKNPPGQLPGGSDGNAGYECDRNAGVGRSNPAHTGCTETNPPTTTVPTTTSTSTSTSTSTNTSTSTSTSDTSTSTSSSTQTPAGGARNNPQNPVAAVLDEAALAFTGANTSWLVLLGLLSVSAGAMALLITRRRRA